MVPHERRRRAEGAQPATQLKPNYPRRAEGPPPGARGRRPGSESSPAGVAGERPSSTVRRWTRKTGLNEQQPDDDEARCLTEPKVHSCITPASPRSLFLVNPAPFPQSPRSSSSPPQLLVGDVGRVPWFPPLLIAIARQTRRERRRGHVSTMVCAGRNRPDHRGAHMHTDRPAALRPACSWAF